eukprot:scaffold52654_cov75-Phaeocystis_antarctica.AAC.8
MLPRLQWRELQLGDQPVDFVEHQHWCHSLEPRLSEDSMRLNADSLHRIHEHERAVAKSLTGIGGGADAPSVVGSVEDGWKESEIEDDFMCSRQSVGDDPIARDQAITECRLPVIHVRDHADVPCGGHERVCRGRCFAAGVAVGGVSLRGSSCRVGQASHRDRTVALKLARGESAG